ncbi:MAG: cytochrome c peroxidase [Spirochaetota bacterium]|nr:cytochrome c peroxidase [Spirochaetota bacterium]
MMIRRFFIVLLISVIGCSATQTSHKSQAVSQSKQTENPKLGLPVLDIPSDNPITKEKVKLGERLFNDTRFSSTGKISCATCHSADKAFTDSPLPVSKGINDLTGTRNAPTIINSAYNQTQFWDGRSPDLEDQSLHPFVNPVEMGLKNHEPILKIIRTDQEYIEAFKRVFKKSKEKITMREVTKAIAAFERTQISANSRFDRWYFIGEPTLTKKEIKGFEVYIGNGRCVSCHVIEHTTALFTDNKFHNVGVGINMLAQKDIDRLASEFMSAKYNKEEVDVKVLADTKTSELGRFAITRNLTELGAFKTPTLRNIALTAPYMHDGSLATLEEVVDHYNRGGASSDEEKINDFVSGGMRQLDLSDEEKSNLVAFMETLTSKEFE